MIDEVEFWGKLKHDNIVKVFIWHEDYSAEPHDKMYLMMQYADMGEIASWKESENKYVANQKIIDYVTRKLTEEEEFKDFGSDCVSMKERVARFLFT